MSELRDLVLVSLADDKANDDGDEHDPEDLEAIEDALMEDGPAWMFRRRWRSWLA